jgi:hypothetical protein
MSAIGNMTSSLIDGVMREIQKDENQRRLRCMVLDPAAKYMENYLKPYFFTLLIVMLLMVGILLWILKIALSISLPIKAIKGGLID